MAPAFIVFININTNLIIIFHFDKLSYITHIHYTYTLHLKLLKKKYQNKKGLFAVQNKAYIIIVIIQSDILLLYNAN